MFSDIIDIIIDCTSCIQKVHTVTHNRWTPYFVIFNVVSYNWYAVVQAWLQSTDSIVEMFSVLLLFLVFHAATWCAYDRNAQENIHLLIVRMLYLCKWLARRPRTTVLLWWNLCFAETLECNEYIFAETVKNDKIWCPSLVADCQVTNVFGMTVIIA